MKVYIVMRDCWFAISDDYERQWRLCDNMGVFDSLDKAKGLIDSELYQQKMYDCTAENFANFCIFMAAADSDIYNEVEDVLERYYHSRYDDVYVISPDLIKQPMLNTYIYYIAEKEVQ